VSLRPAARSRARSAGLCRSGRCVGGQTSRAGGSPRPWQGSLGFSTGWVRGLSPVFTVLLRFVHGIDDRRALREVDIVSSSSRKSFALIFISILSAMLAEWLPPPPFFFPSRLGH